MDQFKLKTNQLNEIIVFLFIQIYNSVYFGLTRMNLKINLNFLGIVFHTLQSRNVKFHKHSKCIKFINESPSFYKKIK